MPAVLVETGYLSNSRDRKKLMDEGFQMKVAQAIFDGIRAYVEGALPEDDLSPMRKLARCCCNVTFSVAERRRNHPRRYNSAVTASRANATGNSPSADAP